ncbi:MAG: glucan biosynthesis glucosyltransferase H, partial [Roseococcus sp.]|nr:glucan biosynthesis glucosyltransferase H [Roseococcus sp.]
MDSLTLAPPLLPAEAPLKMPVRPLAEGGEDRVAAHGAEGYGPRRALVLGGALLLTLAAAHEMSLVVGLARWTVVGVLLTLLFALLFFFIALACTSGLAGFFTLWRGDGGEMPKGPPRSRTALL